MTEKVDVPKDIPEYVPAQPRYSEELAEQFLQLYAEGETLRSLCKRACFPNRTTLWRWLKQHPSFQKRLEEARELRALCYEDDIYEISKTATDLGKDEVAGSRLAFDTLRWAAEVNDSLRYGKKTTVQGDQNNPIRFVISTGFPDLTPEQQPPKLGADGLIIEKKGDANEVKETESVGGKLSRIHSEEGGTSVCETGGSSGESPGDLL